MWAFLRSKNNGVSALAAEHPAGGSHKQPWIAPRYPNPGTRSSDTRWMSETAATHAPRCNQRGHSRHRQIKIVLLGSDSIPRLDTDAFCLRCKDRGIAIEWSSSMPHLRECRRFSDDSRRSRLGIWSGTLVSALRGSLCPPYGDEGAVQHSSFYRDGPRFGRHHHEALRALAGIGWSGSCFSK